MNTRDKIYLISYFFAPLGRADGVNRTLFVKYFDELGWDVEVITGEIYNILILNFQRDPSLLNNIPPSVKIHRFQSDRGWLKYDLKKIIGIKNNLRKNWISNVENGFSPRTQGVFVSILPPIDNAILAYNLSLKYHWPLVLYYLDDFLDVPSHIVKHAKALVCVTSRIAKSLIKTYGHNNVNLIAQGAGEPIACVQKKSIDLPIKIVYAGSFNFRIQPELVGKALKKLKKQRPNIAASLVIDLYGPQGYYLWLFLKPYLNKNVRYEGYLPFDQLMKILPNYDMALTVNRADVAFPSKVYHYLNAGLPIFAITEHPELIHFVQDHSIGITSDNTINDIAEKLSDLAVSKDLILKWRENVLNIRDEFALEKQLKKFHDVLKDLSREPE